jgi:hypothetical protein
MKNNFITGMTILLLSMLACEPVFAIGWREILFVIILGAFLLGPLLYRFLRRLENIRRRKK